MIDIFMGAVSLAFRPYIGKMLFLDYESSIDSRKIINFDGALFEYFLKEKSNPIQSLRLDLAVKKKRI